jgi:hypothetical protein
MVTPAPDPQIRVPAKRPSGVARHRPRAESYRTFVTAKKSAAPAA